MKKSKPTTGTAPVVPVTQEAWAQELKTSLDNMAKSCLQKNKYIKCSVSLIVRKMQIKTMSYHQPEGLKLTTPSVSEDTGRFLLLC
jgi:hypothetical protein